MRPAFSVGSNVKPSAARKELKASSLSLPSVNFERKGSGLSGDQYAVMVSCRCNYTGIFLLWFVAIFLSFFLFSDLLLFLKCFFFFLISWLDSESRLFFKQRTKWRPRVSKDLMISVASEMSGEPCGPHGRASQLPVQVILSLTISRC